MTLGAMTRSVPRTGGTLKRETRVSAMLTAARTLFLEHGYERATMDAIAAVARVSKATLYANFGDKLTLFKSLIDHEIAAADRKISEMTHIAASSVEEKLYEAGLRFFELVTAPSFLALLRVVIADGQRHPALGAAVRRLCTPPADSSFARLIQESGGAHLDDAAQQALVDLFMGMVLGTMQTQLLLDPTCSISALELRQRVRFAMKAFLRVVESPTSLAIQAEKPY